jgi:hypothetical protein
MKSLKNFHRVFLNIKHCNTMGVITLNVSARLNRAPDSSGWNNLVLAHGLIHTFTLANFTTETNPPYSDPEGDALKEVKITSLPFQGVLKLSGLTVSVNENITSSQLSSSLLTYESDVSDLDGYLDSGMEFLVSDVGSSNFTTSPKIFNLKMHGNINRSPIEVGGNELTIGVGSTTVFTRTMFTTGLTPAYEDPEGDAALNLLIDSVPVNGSLMLNGVLVINEQVIPFSEIDSGNFSYVNSSLGDGINPEGFNFKISDVGSEEYIG